MGGTLRTLLLRSWFQSLAMRHATPGAAPCSRSARKCLMDGHRATLTAYRQPHA